MSEHAALTVGVVATPQQWRRDLQGHVVDHVQGVVLRVLHDPADAYGVDVVVLDDTFDFLTRAQVLALGDQGVRVVGVFDETGRHGRGRGPLDALGVQALPIGEGPERLLAAVATIDPTAAQRRRSDGRSPRPPAQVHAMGEGSAGEGSIVVVGGGSGAPGRTEAAVAIAAVLGARGNPTVLIDVDEHDPSIAARLGFEVTPNVLDALAETGSNGRGERTWLGRRAEFALGDVGFDVVCGLASSSDWSQTRELAGLIGTLRSRWRYVVVDTGPRCGPDLIPPGGARNAATRTALRAADHLVGVCTATPLGVLRFLDWAASALELLGGAPLTVVVNRSPTEGFQRAELLSQLTSNLPPDRLVRVEFLPADRAVTSAVWDGLPTGPGPFRGAIQSVVDGILPDARAGRQVRRRTLSLLGARR